MYNSLDEEMKTKKTLYGDDGVFKVYDKGFNQEFYERNPSSFLFKKDW